MTTPVQTLGPADPKAPGFARFYAALAGLLGLVGTASAFGLITSEQAASLKHVGTSAGTLAGAVVGAVAAFRTRKQVANGTFDSAPAPAPVLPPKQQVAQGLQVLVDEAAAKVGDLNDATELASKVLGLGVSVVSAAAVNVHDAVDAAIAAARNVSGPAAP